MGMSTHVAAFKPADKKWAAMKAAWDACEAAGIAIPKEVEKFFEGEPPDEAGVRVSEAVLRKSGCLKEHQAEMEDGFEVDLTKLPPGVTIIRVYNSY